MHIYILLQWSHAFCINCPHLPSDLVMRSKLPSLVWTKDPLFQILPLSDQESSTLPCGLASSCNYSFIITKLNQVVPCLITPWSLIILSSLKPMADFIHWIHLFVCASLGPSHGTPSCHFPLDGFAKSITLLVSPSILILDLLPLRIAWLLSARRDVIMSKPPHDLLASGALPPCAGDSSTGSLLTGWQAVQIANLPWIMSVCLGASQAMICKTEGVTSSRSGKRTKL
jgi:hypothetical protein